MSYRVVYFISSDSLICINLFDFFLGRADILNFPFTIVYRPCKHFIHNFIYRIPVRLYDFVELLFTQANTSCTAPVTYSLNYLQH